MFRILLLFFVNKKGTLRNCFLLYILLLFLIIASGSIASKITERMDHMSAAIAYTLLVSIVYIPLSSIYFMYKYIFMRDDIKIIGVKTAVFRKVVKKLMLWFCVIFSLITLLALLKLCGKNPKECSSIIMMMLFFYAIFFVISALYIQTKIPSEIIKANASIENLNFNSFYKSLREVLLKTVITDRDD